MKTMKYFEEEKKLDKASVESGLSESERFNGTTPTTKTHIDSGVDGDWNDRNNQEQGSVF